MRIVFFDVSCGVGMDNTFVLDCEGMSDEEINDTAYDAAIECANSYGSFYFEDDLPEEDEEDMSQGDCNFTDSDLSYSWEDYIPEKHDMQRCGGGSFKEDIF